MAFVVSVNSCGCTTAIIVCCCTTAIVVCCCTPVSRSADAPPLSLSAVAPQLPVFAAGQQHSFSCRYCFVCQRFALQKGEVWRGQAWREGKDGEPGRWANRGGQLKELYSGFYARKSQGQQALNAWLAKNPKPAKKSPEEEQRQEQSETQGAKMRAFLRSHHAVVFRVSSTAVTIVTCTLTDVA